MPGLQSWYKWSTTFFSTGKILQRQPQIQSLALTFYDYICDIQKKKIQKYWYFYIFFSELADSRTKKLYVAKTKLLMIKMVWENFLLFFWSVIYRPKYLWLHVWQPMAQLLKPVPIYKNFCEVCLRAYHSAGWTWHLYNIKTTGRQTFSHGLLHMETGVESIEVTCVTYWLHVWHSTNFLCKIITLMEVLHIKNSNLGTTNVVKR